MKSLYVALLSLLQILAGNCQETRHLNHVKIQEKVASDELSATHLKSQLQLLEAENREQEEKLKRALDAIGELTDRLEQLEWPANREKRQASAVSAAAVTTAASTTAGRSPMARTCLEARSADPTLTTGMHYIDPDGQGVGDEPIYVHCNMTSGMTSILHDSESKVTVEKCGTPGCHSRLINYKATSRQMLALTYLSDQCHQTIRYDCNNAPLKSSGVHQGWWTDRLGNKQYFWSGQNETIHTCQCGIDKNCLLNKTGSALCNCDAAVSVVMVDHGTITRKDLLPVTRLNFRKSSVLTASAQYTLGRLVCSGKALSDGSMPTSCVDLWRIGHSLSGLYSVKGAKHVQTVYCDFSKLPDEPAFQKWIGYSNVKTTGVYFYVQRNSDFSTQNKPIPFQVERLNVGGAMNKTTGVFFAPKTGKYFFSISGLKDNTIRSMHLALYVNEAVTGSAHGAASAQHYTFSHQSILHLKAKDKVSLRLTSGVLHDDKNLHTAFTGYLIEEDLF